MLVRCLSLHGGVSLGRFKARFGVSKTPERAVEISKINNNQLRAFAILYQSDKRVSELLLGVKA